MIKLLVASGVALAYSACCTGILCFGGIDL